MTEGGDIGDDEAPLVINAVEGEPQREGVPQGEGGGTRVVGAGGSSWLISALIVVNAALGAGILNFPAAFDQAGGILVAMIAQVILVVLAAGSMLVLGWCSDLRGDQSYQAAIGSFCGPWPRRLSSLLVLLYMYGTCITFLVIAGDQSDSVFKHAWGKDFADYWYLNRKFTVSLSALLFVFPLCFVRNVDFLKYPSLLASLSIIYLIGLTAWTFSVTDRSHVHVKTKPDVWTDIFLVIPSLCFAYQCHVSVIPVYSCLRPHSLTAFTKTLCAALGICFLAYSTVGSLGYLTFGTGVRPDLFSSFTPNNPQVLVGFISFGIKNFMTYPILLFCGRLAIDTLWAETGFRPLSRFLIGGVWFFSTLILAAFLPNIKDAIEYLGFTAGLFIFVFPGFCLWNAIDVFHETLLEWHKVAGRLLAGVYIFMGTLMAGMTLTQAIQEDVSSK